MERQIKRYRMRPVIVEAYKLGEDEPRDLESFEGRMLAGFGDYILKRDGQAWEPMAAAYFSSLYEEVTDGE